MFEMCKKVCTILRIYVIMKLLNKFIQHKGDNDNAKICTG